MTIEKNTYLTTLNNKIVYDRTFKAIEKNFKYARFFNNGNFKVEGRGVEFLLTWAKEGIDWTNDLNIYNPSSSFVRKINIIPFRLLRIMDKVYYELVNEERFADALESEASLKDFTKYLIEQISDKSTIDLEKKVPEMICNDDNFIKYNATSKKGNLYEEDNTFWEDPIKILQALFNGADTMEKSSKDFNKGYLKDPDDASKGYEPMETNSQRYVVILNNSTKNTITIGGYKENVNFPALDLEKRFGQENVFGDNLPNNYEMLLLDERAFQLYKKAKKEGYKNHSEEPAGNQWFFFNPTIYGGFITAFNAMAWKRK